MAAAAEHPAPASAVSAEEAATDAPPPMSLLMFLLDGEGGAVEVGRFGLSHPPSPLLPHRAHASAIGTDEAEDANPGKEAAVYLLLLEGADVRGIARLPSLEEGRPAGGAVGDDAAERGGETWEKAEAEIGEEEGAMSREDEMLETSEEKEEEEISGSSDETEEEEGHGHKYYSVQIRMWPGIPRVVLSVFGDGCWEFTKGYRVKWLQQNEKEGVLKTIAIAPEIDDDRTQEFSDDLKKLICAKISANDYRVIKLLGGGSTSKVFQCVARDSVCQHHDIPEVHYAMKIMQITENFDDMDAINNKEPREVKIMSCLKAPCVVSFYQAWITDDDPYFSENLSCSTENDQSCSTEDDLTLRNDLRFGPREINTEESWMLFEEITRAVQCIHHEGIVHRDLKPSNIFFGSNGLVKIADFGHACWATNKIDELKGTPDRGTPMYSAPELKEGQHVTEKTDIFSIGVIFFELFYPFKTGHEQRDVLTNLRKGIHPADWKWSGDSVLLKKLTALIPSNRPSTDEILKYIAQRRSSN
ncbi:Os04g0563600 [Oryza sativa Japonica Group]|uniref:Os04g0563600 protein n=1 Tax=Oryza sativa subsp. japonica TaxID=39947 RepID=A0A0P0WDV4_ORYSJ|nr:Os04g0563600 [Oryza sativa Japonica Group]